MMFQMFLGFLVMGLMVGLYFEDSKTLKVGLTVALVVLLALMYLVHIEYVPSFLVESK
jgi:hypothetical protein